MGSYICQQCGKEFKSYHQTAKFCSKHCQNASLVKIDLNRARSLYESGMTQKEVASELKVSQKAISQAFKRVEYISRKAAKRNQLGEFNDNWKGGVTINNGYIMVKCPNHPRANKEDYVFQHILVMERYLGRYLEYYGQGHPNNEVVHHINHNTQDNRIENLQLMRQVDHMVMHSRERLSKPVRRLDIMETYPSVTVAASSLGVTKRAITQAIEKGTRCKGTYWEYVNKTN
jgi:DNA-directed RNA polymerase subunit RPC12/RpoP